MTSDAANKASRIYAVMWHEEVKINNLIIYKNIILINLSDCDFIRNKGFERYFISAVD